MAKKSQIQKFRDKARELGSDESEARFDAALKAVTRNKGTDAPSTAERKKRNIQDK